MSRKAKNPPPALDVIEQRLKQFAAAEDPKERKKKMAAVDRRPQQMADEDGDTWDLQIVLNGPFDLIEIATLAKFRRRAHLKPEVRRRVVAAARAALTDPTVTAGRSVNIHGSNRLSEAETAEIEGLLAMQASDHWMRSHVGRWLREFGAGRPPCDPMKVILAIAREAKGGY